MSVVTSDCCRLPGAAEKANIYIKRRRKDVSDLRTVAPLPANLTEQSVVGVHNTFIRVPLTGWRLYMYATYKVATYKVAYRTIYRHIHELSLILVSFLDGYSTLGDTKLY